MKGALPSQQDGGWQRAQLGGTTQSSACGKRAGGARGIWRHWGQLEASLAPSTGTACLDRPRNQPRASPQLSIPSPFHPKANSQERALPHTPEQREQGCTCMATHTSPPQPLKALLP